MISMSNQAQRHCTAKHLVVQRANGESIEISGPAVITIHQINRRKNRVKLGVFAEPATRVRRSELPEIPAAPAA
jgi:sRNA-binding carbon storage regulator CsrA